MNCFILKLRILIDKLQKFIFKKWEMMEDNSSKILDVSKCSASYHQVYVLQWKSPTRQYPCTGDSGWLEL